MATSIYSFSVGTLSSLTRLGLGGEEAGGMDVTRQQTTSVTGAGPSALSVCERKRSAFSPYNNPTGEGIVVSFNT